MNIVTVYDTETTNLPNYKVPSDDESQPHLVSLTAIQCNADTEEVIQRIDLIVKSEGWNSHEKAFEAHGITKEHSIEVGISEDAATHILIGLCKDSTRVAHNKNFDQRIIRIALKRYGFVESVVEKWAEKENHHCTMQMSKPIMKLPMNGRGGYKNPNLAEAYKYFTGKDLVNAHSSSADTQACMEIYFAMTREELVKHPCWNCGKEWDAVYVDKCPHCGEEIPF